MAEDWPLQRPLTGFLQKAATRREAVFGRGIELCAIINIKSGSCAMDCAFCIQSRHTDFAGHPLLPACVLRKRLMELDALPLTHIGLVASGKMLSGDDFAALRHTLASLPRALVSKICLSLGQISLEQMKTLKNLGIRRYHHNLETSRRWYQHICSTQKWEQRVRIVENALTVGLEVCSGAIFGIGENWQDRIDLAKTFSRIGVGNIPLNFLHPQPGTPLGVRRPLDAEEALQIIALYRELLPAAVLRVCGGRPLTFGSRQNEIFAAGANALMTGDYLTTAGEGLDHDLELIASAGLDVCGPCK